MFGSVANNLLKVLLAPVCAACHDPLDRPMDGAVCRACWAAIRRLTPPLCDLCGDPLSAVAEPFGMCPRCLSAPPVFELARSAGLFAGPLKSIIHAFKYEGRRTLAAPLARLMVETGHDVLAGADALVPVPMHPWRTMHRGFNQAEDLARHIGLPIWHPIRRARHGPPQAGLNGRNRRSNVSNAFRGRILFSVGWDSGRARRLKNRTVVLIDDVMTTGATLNACSRALLEGGAGRVRVLTAARVPEGPPGARPRERRLWPAPRR